MELTELVGNSGCGNAVVSSNNYFFSEEYLNKLDSTADFYKELLPVINGTFDDATSSFKNAYSSKSSFSGLSEQVAN
jgi:hypothetical protein